MMLQFLSIRNLQGQIVKEEQSNNTQGVKNVSVRVNKTITRALPAKSNSIYILWVIEFRVINRL